MSWGVGCVVVFEWSTDVCTVCGIKQSENLKKLLACCLRTL